MKTMAMEVTQNQADVIIATDDDTCNHKIAHVLSQVGSLLVLP